MTLRIYCDFNSRGGESGDTYWCLRYCTDHPDSKLGRPLDDVAEELRLEPGMRVTLFYADSSEEFEMAAVLALGNAQGPRWIAHGDRSTFRRIRG